VEDPDERADEVVGVSVGGEVAASNGALDAGNEGGMDEWAGALDESCNSAGDRVHRGDDKPLVGDMFDEEEHPSAEGFKRRHGGSEALLGGSKLFHFAAVDGFDESVPGGEVAVKRAGSDACLAGDVVETGGSAVAGEYLFGDLKDALSVAQGISAGFARGW